MEDGFAAGLGNTRSDFGYNPASQLAGETRTNDAYAWMGSVAVNRNYAANGLNQYTSAGPATFTYDPNGNLTSDGTTSFVYDSENRLVSASGAKNATLVYDPLGRLFQISSPNTGTTQFLYDGNELIAEYNGSGALLRRYLHGDSDDDPLMWYEGPIFDTPRFPHSDRRGSVTAIAGTGGTLLSINTYDEYGIPGVDQRSAAALGRHGRFQYTGQAWIPELGMYYYKARFYSPALGRFLQVDPIGYEDQINIYAYVGNDPINKLDPSGLADVDYMNRYDGAYDQELGRNFDMSGTVTVMAHGSPISQRRSNESWDVPRPRTIASAINKVSRSQPIFLGACSLAGDAEGLQQIAEISRLTGNRPIMASTGYIRFSKQRGGGTSLTAYHPRADGTPNPNVSAEFKVFNGSFADFGINVRPGFSVTGFNVGKNGDITAVTTGFRTGSRIRQTEHQKVDGK